MAFFERIRRSQPAGSDAERAKLADSMARAKEVGDALDESGRRRGYAEARLTDLLPDLREEARLKILVQTAEGRLARAQTLLNLRDRAGALAAKSSDGRAEQITTELASATKELEARKHQLEAARNELDNVRVRIAARDRELREQFGINA